MFIYTALAKEREMMFVSQKDSIHLDLKTVSKIRLAFKKIIFNFFKLTLNNHTVGYCRNWLALKRVICWAETFSELCQVDHCNSHYSILEGHNTISTFSLHPQPSPSSPLSFQSCLLLGFAFGQTSNQNLCISLWVYFLLEKTHSYKNHDSLTS